MGMLRHSHLHPANNKQRPLLRFIIDFRREEPLGVVLNGRGAIV